MRVMPEFGVSCHIARFVFVAIRIRADMREARLSQESGLLSEFANDWRMAGLRRFVNDHSAKALSTTSVASASTLSRASGDSKDSAYTL